MAENHKDKLPHLASEIKSLMYEFHPLADIFPMLDDNELKALAEDIKTKGLTEPITLYEGKVLDGRNRYRACDLAKVELDQTSSLNTKAMMRSDLWSARICAAAT